MSDLIHCPLQLLLGDVEVLGPVPNLMLFIHVDLAAICVPVFFKSAMVKSPLKQ